MKEFSKFPAAEDAGKVIGAVWTRIMGLAYPASVHDYVSLIAPFLDSDIPLLRERTYRRGSYKRYHLIHKRLRIRFVKSV